MGWPCLRDRGRQSEKKLQCEVDQTQLTANPPALILYSSTQIPCLWNSTVAIDYETRSKTHKCSGIPPGELKCFNSSLFWNAAPVLRLRSIKLKTLHFTNIRKNVPWMYFSSGLADVNFIRKWLHKHLCYKCQVMTCSFTKQSDCYVCPTNENITFDSPLHLNTCACVDRWRENELTVAWASPEGARWTRQHQETGGSMERAPMGEVSWEYLYGTRTEESSF